MTTVANIASYRKALVPITTRRMLTGRYAFREHARLLNRPLVVLLVEERIVRTGPLGMYTGFTTRWRDATAKDVAELKIINGEWS